MVKINFQNNITKANADTFNTMQDNIENGINDGVIEAKNYADTKYGLLTYTNIPISLSTNGSNIILNFTFDDMLTTGLLLIQGAFVGATVVQISILANYGTRYSTKLVSTTGSNINMSTTTLSSDGATLTIPCLGNVPTGLGSVKAILIS